MSDAPSWQEMQKEFMTACDVPAYHIAEFLEIRPLRSRAPLVQALQLGYNLINEEINTELLTSLRTVIENNKKRGTYTSHTLLDNEAVEIYDGIVDAIYVLCQLANMMGLDLVVGYQEVHDANMTKVQAGGKVIRRPDGKILKPEGWKPPKMLELLMIQAEQSKSTLGKNQLSDVMQGVRDMGKLDNMYMMAFKDMNLETLEKFHTELQALADRAGVAINVIKAANNV